MNQPGPVFEYRAADKAAQAAGAPVCLDLTVLSGDTTSKGMTVNPLEAVASFLAKPDSVANNNANMILSAGVIEEAYAAGEHKTHIVCGPSKVRIKNTTAVNMTYGVGQALILEPGQDYYTPVYSNISAGGTTKLSSKGGACVRAIVTVAKTIAAGDTDLTNAYIFMPGGPVPFSVPFVWDLAADVPAAFPAYVTNGPGIITRAGFGVAVGGAAGSLTMDVLIDTVSAFTTKPVIEDNCTDPCHTLAIVDTAVATYLGTLGVFGLLDNTKTAFKAGAIISATMVNGSSFAGTGIQMQIDGLYF